VRRALTRVIYFAALIAFAVYLGNTFAGGYIYPRGEGLVIGEPAVVAAEFVATVTDVLVKDGQEVNRSEIVSHISSQYMSEARAKLTSDYAARALRLAEVKARREVVDAVLASAETRERVAANGLAQLDTIQKKGYLPMLTHAAATDHAFKGKQEARRKATPVAHAAQRPGSSVTARDPRAAAECEDSTHRFFVALSSNLPRRIPPPITGAWLFGRPQRAAKQLSKSAVNAILFRDSTAQELRSGEMLILMVLFSPDVFLRVGAPAINILAIPIISISFSHDAPLTARAHTM